MSAFIGHAEDGLTIVAPPTVAYIYDMHSEARHQSAGILKNWPRGQAPRLPDGSGGVGVEASR